MCALLTLETNPKSWLTRQASICSRQEVMAAVLYLKVSNNVNAPSWCLLQLDSFPAYKFVISQQVTPGLTSQSQRGVSSAATWLQSSCLPHAISHLWHGTASRDAV